MQADYFADGLWNSNCWRCGATRSGLIDYINSNRLACQVLAQVRLLWALGDVFFRIKVSQLTSIHCVWTREGYAYATFTWVLKCSRKKCSYKRWSSCKGMTRLGLSETVVSRMPNNLSQSRLTMKYQFAILKRLFFWSFFFMRHVTICPFFQSHDRRFARVGSPRQSQTVPGRPGRSGSWNPDGAFDWRDLESLG